MTQEKFEKKMFLKFEMSTFIFEKKMVIPQEGNEKIGKYHQREMKKIESFLSCQEKIEIKKIFEF
jgi:hypothetical protein